jgi:hypothetical protein
VPARSAEITCVNHVKPKPNQPKVFWFFFSKKEQERKRFFLKKEAKTFICWASLDADSDAIVFGRRVRGFA